MNVKRSATLVLFGLLSASLFVCPQQVRADEPIYQNKSLTSWLQDFPYGNYQLYYNAEPEAQRREKQQAAERAIQAMGEKALPSLLERLAAISSPAADSKPDRRRLSEQYEQSSRTLMAFTALGAKARPAIPELIQLLVPVYDAAHQSLSEPDAQLKNLQANTAASALRRIGDASIPPLIEALADKDIKIRFGAATALGDFYDQAKAVVPSLIMALEDKDTDVRWRAVRSIGDLGQMPEVSVPALAKRVHEDSEVSVRLYAISALVKFGADARPAIPTLGQATNDPDPVVQSEVQEALQKIRTAVAQKAAGG